MAYLSKAALLATALSLVSFSVSAETLRDAVLKATTDHPSVRSANAAYKQTVDTVNEQKSGYYPELSANASFGRIYGDNATSRGLSVTRGAGYSWLGEGGGSMTQTIYDWRATGARVDAAKAREESASSSLMDARAAVALRAVQAYIAVLRSADLLARADENLAAMLDYQSRIETQVAEGGADEGEKSRASDYVLLATNIKTEFDGQYQSALADYIEATGGKPEGGLTRPDLPEGLPRTVDGMIEMARSVHPQVAAAKKAIEALGFDADVEKVSDLPVLSGELSYQQRDQKDLIGGESTDARALLKMNWNYSTGGAQKSRLSRARHQQEEAQARLDDIYRTLERNVRIAWSALDVATRQRDAQEGRREATANVLETYKEQYEGSKKGLTDLMQAQSQAFDADIAFVNADYAVLNAVYTIEASTGNLLSEFAQDIQVSDAAQ